MFISIYIFRLNLTYIRSRRRVLKVNTVICNLSVKQSVFADADKQQALNLFLGIFLPLLEKRNIWELPSDYYLHHNTTLDLKASKTKKRLVLNTVSFQ